MSIDSKKVEDKRENMQEEQLKNKRKNQNKYRVYNKIINSFYNEINKTQENTIVKLKKPIKIFPEIIYNDQTKKLKIEFKIGEEQTYKIKNLIEFYDRINNSEIYKYGTGLEFQHVRENFYEGDLKLLDFIMKYAEIIKFANEGSNSYQHYGYGLNKGSIMISNTSLDEIFEVFKDKNINFQNNYTKDKLYFNDGLPKIKFYLEENNEDEYKLYTDSDFFDYKILNGKKHIYILENNNLYRCNKDIKNKVLKMIKIFKENYTTEIVFKKEESPKFFSLVMPNIEANINLEKVSSEELERYIPAELNVKLYLDYDENNYILADLKFYYKDIEFNPLKNLKLNQDFARDIVKENQVIDMFVKSGFMLDKTNKRLILANEDKIYNFLSKEIEDYMRQFEVLVTEDFKTREIKQPKISSLGVKIENNLLEIKLEELNFNKKELVEIINKYKLKKKYYRLKDGSFLDLSKNEVFDLLQGIGIDDELVYNKINNNSIKLPMYRTLYLDTLLNKIKTNVKKNENYKQLINDIKQKDIDDEIKLPKGLNAKLRTYQKTGVKWLKNIESYKLGGILADDMGLGKTLQLIVLILEYVQNNKDRKTSFVVCPSSLILNWENEIKKFAPMLKILVVNGNLTERKSKISKIHEYDIVITSYDLLKRDIQEYQNLDYLFKYIIADEAQYIKNNNTQNFKAIKKLKSETRYALTGTPIENSLSELWSIFDFIMPGYLFNYKKFKELYEVPIIKDDDKESIRKLKMLIEPFVLRRIKEDVLTELPDKTITILNNKMEEEQSKVYLSYMMKAKKEIEQEINENGFKKSQIKILALLMRLRQICCHPSLFIENYKGESSKLNQCIELVNDAVQSNHKILLFSGYTSMFDIIEKELEKRGIKYYKLTGQTKVTERVKLVDEFNNDNSIKVFLISLKAGGTGLNLIGADTVIHYDPWWNLSTENQATDRTYRIGQKRNVQVYKLITVNSIEERIYELQQRKAKLIDNMLSTNETFVNKLSKEEIMNLFE